jgi:hypothetical protein
MCIGMHLGKAGARPGWAGARASIQTGKEERGETCAVAFAGLDEVPGPPPQGLARLSSYVGSQLTVVAWANSPSSHGGRVLGKKASFDSARARQAWRARMDRGRRMPPARHRPPEDGL